MKYCKTCVAKCTGAGGEGYAPNCTTYVQEEKKKMTNADRSRSMTDEELAKFFVAELPSCKDCSEPETELGFCSKKCDSLYLRWLQSEVKPE